MMQVDFAIITIREDEFEAVLQRFAVKAQQGDSKRAYGIAQVKTQAGQTYTVAIVRCAEQGADTAHQVANDVINDLDPQILLVVGIAGGVPHDDFTLGDVIISNRIDNFNESKRAEDGKETFNMKGGIHPFVTEIVGRIGLYQKELAGWNTPMSITLDRPPVSLAQFDTDAFQKKLTTKSEKHIAAWYKDLQDSITYHFESTRLPLFKTGTIASSNSLIRDIDLLVQWLQNARSILAVEMESAGVYQASQKMTKQYPVMAIRGISDIIGLDRDRRWTKYACQTAAAFTYAFITAGIVPLRINALEKGKQALWAGDYAAARKELRKAVEEINRENKREASQARYLSALALLEGKLPRSQGDARMQAIEELMNNAIALSPAVASYYRIFASIKKDALEHNGLYHRLNEVYVLLNKRSSLQPSEDDEENERYFRHCQPKLIF
jgi:nucleoside phosphorylase